MQTEVRTNTKPPLRMKDAFASFYMPMHWMRSLILGVLVVIEIARIPLGLGFNFNMITLFITLALFYYGASRLRHVITAGVHPTSHAIGGLLFGTVWSVTVAIANTASATAAYLRDYYYYSTDSFFVRVDGLRQLIDTNGDPYTTPDGAITVSQFGINFAIHLACLAGIAALGALLGTMRARWNALVVVAFTAVAIFFSFQSMMWMYNAGIRIAAPVPGVFLFMVPLAIVATIAALTLSLTSIPRAANLY